MIPPRRDPAPDCELCPGARWDDFQAARARFLGRLAAQSALYRLRMPAAPELERAERASIESGRPENRLGPRAAGLAPGATDRP